MSLDKAIEHKSEEDAEKFLIIRGYTRLNSDKNIWSGLPRRGQTIRVPVVCIEEIKRNDDEFC